MSAASPENGPLIVVSGFPRSGTSMMMQMLSAAGIPVLTDNKRKSDNSNPYGYFEYEPVKNFPFYSEWIKQFNGYAVKIVSPLLKYLPEKEYKIIYMLRNVRDIIDSEDRMLANMGKSSNQPMSKRLKETQDHINKTVCSMYYWNSKVIIISYNDALNEPYRIARKVCNFVGILDEDKISNAAKVVAWRVKYA